MHEPPPGRQAPPAPIEGAACGRVPGPGLAWTAHGEGKNPGLSSIGRLKTPDGIGR